MTARQAYPLQWPLGWPRTAPDKRQHGQFKQSVEGALSNLRSEVKRMGGKDLVLSSNCTLGQTNPKDQGVVAYFIWEETEMAIPCDRWLRVEHNVQAIALTVEAMRGIERWGAKHMIRAMFTGFKALPTPSGGQWWEVLGVHFADSAETVRNAYRALAKKHHPDTGGDAELFRRVSDAYEQFQQMNKAA